MREINEASGLYCLNRGWKFIEKDFSVFSSAQNHEDVYGLSKGGAARGPAEVGFDDTKWQSVELPHDWVTEKPFAERSSPDHGYKERGIGWYRMKFALSEDDRNKQILIEFEGMSADAWVYVNGMLLKRSYSGYNSFSVDMTDMANFGEVPNVIAIRIDASAWEGWWYEGAGIYRNVWLYKKSPIHLAWQGIWLKPVQTEDGKWKLHIEATVENSFEHSCKFRIEHTLLNKNQSVVGVSVAEACVNGFGNSLIISEIELENPDLWDIDCPNLYQVRSAIKIEGEEVDCQIHRTGFRTIRLDSETGFWLNGRRVKLKGFCNHQDHAGVGVAVPFRVKEYRIHKLKKLGANAYRCAHNPDPEILAICDREGMLVMEENRTFSSAKDNLEEIKGIVRNARNHPSVTFYSVFNEEPLQGTGKGRRIAGRLQAAIKEMDDTRPVMGAFNGGYLEDDGAATILDAVGINYNPARYDAFHSKYPGTPLIASETASAFMVRGEYLTDYEKNIIDDYGNECAYWGNTIKDAWQQVDQREFVAGSFVWTGFDYRGEPTPFSWPSVGTYFGTYDSCGFEKNACCLYRAFWEKEPIIYLVSPWNTEFKEGTLVKVRIYTNCQEVEIFVNGLTVGKRQVEPYEQIEYEIPYQKGKLEAVGYDGVKAVAWNRQMTAETAERLVLEPVFFDLRDNGHDVEIINVSLTDKNGTVLPNADDMVYFEIENGIILGVGNGSPISHEPDIAPFRKLFHGKAQLILKASGNSPVAIYASTDSGFRAELTIPVIHSSVVPYIEPVDEKVVDGWKMYYRLFDEMPNPALKVDGNDMNSFEPVSFTGNPQPELSGKIGKYAMYRVKFEAGNPCTGRKLCFPKIQGHVYVYLDEKEIARRTGDFYGGMTVLMEQKLKGEHELTVIIWNGNEKDPNAGICAPVYIVN